MPLPLTNRSVPFNVTRFSHVVLHVRDLDESRAFYEDLIGLIVTEQDGDSLFLRGVEETCHHSLVLRRAAGSLACERIGFRVLDEDDLDRAKKFFDFSGRDAELVDVPHQGRTLRLHDPGGIPVEMCARMPVQRREIIQFASHRGAASTRIDHVQAHVADIAAAANFTENSGSESPSTRAATEPTKLPSGRSSWHEKATRTTSCSSPIWGHGCTTWPTLFTTPRPRSCEFAIWRQAGAWVSESSGAQTVTASATSSSSTCSTQMGTVWSFSSSPYQLIDLEDEPYGWSTEHDDIRNLWGPDPPESWLSEATHFYGIEPKPPAALEPALPDASRAHHGG